MRSAGSALALIVLNSAACSESVITAMPTLTSCAAIKAATPAAADGTYLIDPDGSGGAAPFSVWCDMTFDGGGWTALPLQFANTALWSLSHSGSACTSDPAVTSNGSLLSVQNGMNPTGWGYLSIKFVPPIRVKEVWLDQLSHSTSTVCNNMDITYTMTPAATTDTTVESWYFAGSDPTVPLGYTFADGCSAPAYTDPGAAQPECSMAKPGSDALVTIDRRIKLQQQAAAFHMVAVEGCGSDPPCDLATGQAERFYINHPPTGGLWKDGILVR